MSGIKNGDVVAAAPPQTKWSIIQRRIELLEFQAAQLRDELIGLACTPCGIQCAKCGTMLETEADFAKHFVVSDPQFLNLGECPAEA